MFFFRLFTYLFLLLSIHLEQEASKYLAWYANCNQLGSWISPIKERLWSFKSFILEILHKFIHSVISKQFARQSFSLNEPSITQTTCLDIPKRVFRCLLFMLFVLRFVQLSTEIVYECSIDIYLPVRHNVLIYVLFLFIYEEKSKISKVFSKTFPKVQYISKNVVPEGIKKELIHVLHRNKTLTRASCSILVSESFCMIYLFAVRLNRNGYWQNEKLLKREKVIIPYYNGLAAFLEVDLTLCSIF